MTGDLTSSNAEAGLVIAALWWIVWWVIAVRLKRTEAPPRWWRTFAYELCLLSATIIGILSWTLVGPPIDGLLLGRLSWWSAAGTGLVLGVLWWLVLAGRDRRTRLAARRRMPSPHGAALAGVYALDAAGEEVMFRGLLLGGLAGLGLGSGWAIAVSATAFGAMHVFALGPAGVPGHIMFGLLLGAAFLLGGLLAPITAHVVYNTLVVASRGHTHIDPTSPSRTAPTEGRDHP